MSETTEVQHLPRPARGPGWVWIWVLVMPLIGGLIGYFAGAGMAYVAPKRYESKTVLQISMPQRATASVFGAEGSSHPTEASWFATEFEVIKAEQTLLRVGQRLDLTSRWMVDEGMAVSILKGVVETERIEGTDLVEIRVRHTNANDARDVADKVGEAYQERRRALTYEQAQSALDALDAELRDQEDLVETKRKVLDTIVQAIGIPYVEGGNDDPAVIRQAEQEYEKAFRAAMELEGVVKDLEAEMKEVANMDGEALKSHILGLEDPPAGLVGLRKEYLLEKKVLELMGSSGGGDGEARLRQTAKVAVAEEEFERVIGQWKSALEARLALAKNKLEVVRSERNEWRDRAVDRSLEAHDYTEAKREYENAQSMLQKMKLRHSQGRIELRMPRSSVIVHEQARVGRMPVEPRVKSMIYTGLGIGALAGLLLGLLIVVLASGRRSTPPPLS